MSLQQSEQASILTIFIYISLVSACSSTSADRATLHNELAALKNGGARRRAQQLATVRVVGVTCAASVFGVLDGHCFPFLFLDEVRAGDAFR